MTSATSRVEVTTSRSVPTDRLRHRHRQGRPFTGPVRTFMDDSGTIAITAWNCALCSEPVEEIHDQSRDRALHLYRIRDAVAPQVTIRRPAALAASREATVTALAKEESSRPPMFGDVKELLTDILHRQGTMRGLRPGKPESGSDSPAKRSR